MKQTVLITGARAPVALHWCRLFDAAGWGVVVADSLNAPLARFSRTAAHFEPLPSPVADPAGFAKRIGAVVEQQAIELILPTCEEVFHLASAAQAGGHAASWRDKLFAPSLDALLTLHDKGRFNALIAEIAPSFAPAFRRLEDPSDVAAVPGADWVFKPCFSRFGTDTVIRPGTHQRAALKPTLQTPWIAQEFVPGRELCCSAVVAQGQVMALQVYRPVVRLRGGAGAGIAFEAAGQEDHEGVAPLVEAIAAATEGRGQISLDVRADGSGQFKALECNPRSTSGLHFFRSGDGLVRAVTRGQPTPFRAVPGGLMGERLATALVGRWTALSMLPRMHSLSAWPGDRLSWISQARAFMELLRIARQNRCSLETATTLDISWNTPQIP